MRLALAAQRKRSVTGESGMIGTVADVVATIAPGQAGQVRVHSEIWSAESAQPVRRGQRVRVVALRGLTLTVEEVKDA